MAHRTHRNLDEAYLYATEVNLATLEELCSLASSSQSRIKRQRSICLDMLSICDSTMVGKLPGIWGTERQPSFPRLQRLLADAKCQPEGLIGAIDGHITGIQAYRSKG
jgi:hypothetical protein